MGSPVDPDSRARTHLANERTFLAWFRTGLTLLAFGLAAAQFLARDVAGGFPVVRLIATLVLAIGLFLVAVGLYRYARGRDRIDSASFHPAGTSVVIATVAAFLVGALAVLFVWLVPGR